MRGYRFVEPAFVHFFKILNEKWIYFLSGFKMSCIGIIW